MQNKTEQVNIQRVRIIFCTRAISHNQDENEDNLGSKNVVV